MTALFINKLYLAVVLPWRARLARKFSFLSLGDIKGVPAAIACPGVAVTKKHVKNKEIEGAGPVKHWHFSDNQSRKREKGEEKNNIFWKNKELGLI